MMQAINNPNAPRLSTKNNLAEASKRQSAFMNGKSLRNSQPLITQASDADELAEHLTDWQQEYNQISAGGFQGTITEIVLEDLQVFHEYTSQSLHQKCNVWADSIWLGLPQNTDKISKINGLDVHHNTIMCRPGNCQFELLTPDQFDIYGMVVSQPKLQQMADLQGIELNWFDLTHQGRLDIPKSTLQSIHFLLNRLLKDQIDTPQKLQQDLVMMALLEVLQKETPHNEEAPSYRHRKQVVEQIQQYIQQNKDVPLTITDLCQVANVSRRTLQYSFESILNVSPIQYLRLTRLNGVRRSLHQTDNPKPVSDIAAQWGFWHLSQFAKDYKQLFGELPSETLQKSLGKLRN
jgi:AraC family ethanolamine operon transcriptional activator